jgi:hypothetical protein
VTKPIDLETIALELGQLRSIALGLRDRMRKASAAHNLLGVHANRFDAIDTLVHDAQLHALSCARVEARFSPTMAETLNQLTR